MINNLFIKLFIILTYFYYSPLITNVNYSLSKANGLPVSSSS